MLFTGLYNIARKKIHYWKMRRAIDRSLNDAATITQFRLMRDGARAWELLQKIEPPELPAHPTKQAHFDDLVVDLVGSIAASYGIDNRLKSMFESQIPPTHEVVSCLKSLGFSHFDALPENIKKPQVPEHPTPETRHAAAAYLIGKFIEKPESFPRIQDASLYYRAYFSEAAVAETKHTAAHQTQENPLAAAAHHPHALAPGSLPCPD